MLKLNNVLKVNKKNNKKSITMKKTISLVAIVATVLGLFSCIKQMGSGPTKKETIDGITYSVSYFYEKTGGSKCDLSASVSLGGIETSLNDVRVTFDGDEIISEETIAIPWEKDFKWRVKKGKHSLDFNFKTQSGSEGRASIVFEVSRSSVSVVIQ